MVVTICLIWRIMHSLSDSVPRGGGRLQVFFGQKFDFTIKSIQVLFTSSKLAIIFQQDNESALLQLALAMSMDDPASSQDMRDTDISDAAADPEIALGNCMLI